MNKQKYVDLGRTVNLFNVSLFKNPRTYVIGIALPIFISILLQFLWTRFTYSELTPPEMISFMYVPVVIGSFYIGYFSNEMRHNLFRKKINVKINNQDVIKLSLIILTVEIAVINLVITTILFYIISNFNIIGFKKDLFDNLMAFVWVYYVIFGVMLGIMSGVIFLLIESSFTKRVYSVLLISFALLFMLVFSDTVIPSKIISDNKAMTIVGYLDPIKYITWSMNLISSYQFEDVLGKSQIFIGGDNTFEPFKALWQTTVPAIIILIGLMVGYGFKKDED